MAEFKLDRFKYRWRGDWASGTAYRRDDIVRLNGKSWVCLVGHTSNVDFGVDLNATVAGSNPPIPDPRWTIMTGAKSFAGEWQTSTYYYLGDIVLYDGTLWLCATVHQSTNFEADFTNWQLFGEGIDFKGNWQTGTDYGAGALVKYGSLVYKCIFTHTSNASAITGLEADISNWEVYFEGSEFKGEWSIETIYRKNDLVKYGGSVWKCTASHQSTTTFDNTKFAIEFAGFQFNENWQNNVIYEQGDVVTYGGKLWYAVSNNLDQNPGTSQDSTIFWTELSDSYNFRGDWTFSENYRPGDVVQRGGNLYVAKFEIGAAEEDGSSRDIIDADVWELLNVSSRYRSSWEQDINYNINDIVIYRGTTYKCIEPHTSDALNNPEDGEQFFNYWDILVQRGTDAGLQNKGDLLTYGLNKSIIGDDSTQGLTNVPIGNNEELLSITDDFNLFYRTYLNDADVIYVSTTGRDEPGYGTSILKPFRSVSYALEYVEDNFQPLDPVKVSVSTGRYEELCPMIVPAGTVVNGDELRSTTIVANSPIAAYQNDFNYVTTYLTHFENFLPDLAIGNSIEPSFGNTAEQTTVSRSVDENTLNIIGTLIEDYINTVEFRTADGSTSPSMTSTNTITTTAERLNAANAISENREFLIAEFIAYLNISYPSIVFDHQKTRRDANSILRGLEYDLRYPGNYKTLMAARKYSNGVNGSQLDDMFYLRDTTGLRNCTVEGLEGVLNPPGTFELFRRPTGGAFCSLDPGWGPADNRTWIVNRSPYIQGVTTIGTACVGQKIDGNLHNGGNKSMVSNDFTQVLSDGVGAWVLNNGRAELVSVFTYYNAIGYFAENGGVIRATNGNCSYGIFGAIADGNDPNETAQTAKVFNRNNEAIVSSVFAGEFTDEIFLFEYDHAGSHYSSATATITGAGADADVEFDDFRDGAVMQLRLINPEGSGAVGGSGYTLQRGNAQTGNTTTITLSQTSDFLEADLLGQRIIIVSGDGTGQYGYIQAYNAASKLVTVYKESDDTPGWDHIIPGTPIESLLTTNAQYSIEPRITATSPGYSTQAFSLGVSADIKSVTFGNTADSFNNIAVDTGSGTTEGDAEAAVARFNVTRIGTDYTVTLVTGGAGYAEGDELTILGTSVGGATPTNDIVITVTSTTDDSTNSIDGFTFEGTSIGGRFVAIAQPNIALYSQDGETWTQTSLPVSNNWKRIVSGNGSFVAIAGNSNAIAYSDDGENWVSRSLPANQNWSDVAYGNGRYVAIAENSNTAAYSTDGGLTWQASTIPDDLLGDSTASQWLAISYGQGKFIAIAGNDSATATSEDGINWNRSDDSTKLPTGYESIDWARLEYGGNRWIAIGKQGQLAYSLDGNIWYQGEDLPSLDGSTPMNWKDLKYGQGVFVAVCDTGSREFGEDFGGVTTGPTDFVITSEDGITWTERTLEDAKEWAAVCFASISDTPTFVALAANDNANSVNKIETGATLKLRANIVSGAFASVKIWDPGSGYTSDPTVTVVDNGFGTEVGFQIRRDNGVLAQPSFINRGIGYRTSSTRVTISGNGYADIIPEGTTLVLSGVETVPGPGAQIRISGILDETTEQIDDLIRFTAVSVTDLGDDGSGAGTRLVQFRISPSLEIEYNLAHDTDATIRTRYSQCRISGHDFLDVGTGNFEQTNYPELYAGGAFFTAAPENEVVELNGGRVFYTSTDQDGNFRAGELFSVEQATGIVTISADFFQLDGLSELALGGVRLGGSGTVVREFSTDPNFTEDSNNVIPTQRAIATFLANRLSEGGSEIETNILVAGQVRIGGENNTIETSTGTGIDINAPVAIEGSNANISGAILAQIMATRSS